MDRQARILIVDDLPQNARLLEAMLSPQGYSTSLAHSGREGLEKVRTEHPDLILLDIVMPDMSGYEVCRRLRQDSETRLLPVVMVTSSGEQDKVDAIEAGADDFIARPLNPPELLSRVRSLLRIKEYHDTIAAQADELAQWSRTLEHRVESQLAQLEGLDRLRRFFSTPVAELILAGGGQMLEPHRRDVTVVFCNLRGFTAFAAAAEPEDVMGALNEFYEAVGQLILRFEATLEQFAGDSVMTIFNDPVPCADHTAAAVRMAVETRERTKELSHVWHLNGYDLDVSMAIAEGYATLGRVGFEGRFDYRATGTVVNLASRLCSHALGGQILLAPRAYASVTDLVDVESVGSLQLEGFHDPIHAYNVTGFKNSASSRHEPAIIGQRVAPNAFLCEGDFWSLTYEGVVVRLKDSKGLRDLARLLATPGREVAAVDLASGAHQDARRSASAALGLGVETDAGETLDAQARTQYRSRLADLEEEISEAEANNDPERASRAREEREFLVAELGAAVGLGGRPRRLLDPAERARKAVTGRLLDAITHLEKVHRPLGKHLRHSVRTGSFCIYDPAESTLWRLVETPGERSTGQP
jgi:class 3 adenylate cyclase